MTPGQVGRRHWRTSAGRDAGRRSTRDRLAGPSIKGAPHHTAHLEAQDAGGGPQHQHRADQAGQGDESHGQHLAAGGRPGASSRGAISSCTLQAAHAHAACPGDLPPQPPQCQRTDRRPHAQCCGRPRGAKPGLCGAAHLSAVCTVMWYSTAAQARPAVGKPKAHICKVGGRWDVRGWREGGGVMVMAPIPGLGK